MTAIITELIPLPIRLYCLDKHTIEANQWHFAPCKTKYQVCLLHTLSLLIAAIDLKNAVRFATGHLNYNLKSVFI